MFFSRGKNKLQNPITIIDSYDSYAKSIEKGSPYDIGRQEYLNICYLFFKLANQKVIEEGKELRLPGIGDFSIAKKRMTVRNRKYAGVDFKLTNELGQRIIYTNDHSSGYKYFFRWGRLHTWVKNLQRYRFVPTRHNKRRLAYIIKNRIRDYFEI